MRIPTIGLAGALGTSLSMLLASTAMAAVGTGSEALRAAVTVDGIRAHQIALQAIADANKVDGVATRASGTAGFGASAAYVAGQLPAGYFDVSVQPFDFPFFEELSPAVLAQVSPQATSYTLDVDFATMEYSGSGDIVAPLQAVDLVLPPSQTASTSTSGCEAADFQGFVTGRIALIQRGSCTFAQKAQNAATAGAIGVIIFNEGNQNLPDRTELLNGTLGSPVQRPVVGTTFALGNALAAQLAAGPVLVRLKTDTVSELRQTANVIAESKAGRSDRVVVVGAHLDSVTEGPGINDNGSGTAAILEIARQMAALGIQPRNRVRFAWWGAEEGGLLGSTHYVGQLTKTQLQQIALNLNFDMLGSPNFVRFVYDGDGSDTPQAGPNGSGVIEDVFAAYFAAQRLASAPTAFDGRSDYGPFIDAGIPAGGLFSGAEDIKTAEEAAIFGGKAGAPHDPCYHQGCDDLDNNSNEALGQLSDAAADAVLQFAMTTSAVKGTSKANDKAVKSVAIDSLEWRGSHLQK